MTALTGHRVLRRLLLLAGLALGFWLLSLALHTTADARQVAHSDGTHSDASTDSAPRVDQLLHRTLGSVTSTVDRSVDGVDRVITRSTQKITSTASAGGSGSAANDRPVTRVLTSVTRTAHDTTTTVRKTVHRVAAVADTTVRGASAGRPVDDVVGRTVRGLLHGVVGGAIDDGVGIVTDPTGLPGTVATGGLLTGTVVAALPVLGPLVAVPAHGASTAQTDTDRADRITTTSFAADQTVRHHGTTARHVPVVRQNSGDGSPATPGPATPSEGGEPGSPSPARGGGDLGSTGPATAVAPVRLTLVEGLFADDSRLFGTVAREPGFSPD